MDIQQQCNLWNTIKIFLNEHENDFLFHEGEIWLAHVGRNVGIEQNGKGDFFVRPVLIFRKYNKKHFLAIPLTTKKQAEHISFHLDERNPFLKNDSWIVFSQIKAMDTRRLHRKMGKLSGVVFKMVKNKSAQILISEPRVP